MGKAECLIRALKPPVIIPLDRNGIYGHYDRIAVHRWTTIAVRLAADADCFPHHVGGSCVPHQVSKVYYCLLSQRAVDAMTEDHEPAALMMDEIPFYMVGRSDDEITTVIDVKEYVMQKLEGIQSHPTHVGDQNPFADAREYVLRDPGFCREYVPLAHSTVGWSEETEGDLFTGLR